MRTSEKSAGSSGRLAIPAPPGQLAVGAAMGGSRRVEGVWNPSLCILCQELM